MERLCVQYWPRLHKGLVTNFATCKVEDDKKIVHEVKLTSVIFFKYILFFLSGIIPAIIFQLN